MVTHSSILAWEIPWTEEPGGLQSTRSQTVEQEWVPNTFRVKALQGFVNLTCLHWEEFPHSLLSPQHLALILTSWHGHCIQWQFSVFTLVHKQPHQWLVPSSSLLCVLYLGAEHSSLLISPFFTDDSCFISFPPFLFGVYCLHSPRLLLGSFLFLINISWLCWVLVAAPGPSSCGAHGLVTPQHVKS